MNFLWSIIKHIQACTCCIMMSNNYFMYKIIFTLVINVLLLLHMHIMIKLGFVRIWGHGGEGMRRVMYGVMREGVGASV